MGLKRPSPTEAEIAVLEALGAQSEKLSAKIAGTPEFGVPLLFVDPARRFLILGSSGKPSTDAAFTRISYADLSVEWGEWRIAFPADGAEPCRHDGEAAIRVRFPEFVSINRRRMHERSAVPETASLRCVAYSGDTAIFEAPVIDVSRGGIGVRLDSESIALAPGMVLPRCRLEKAGRKPVAVDLEVRHMATESLASGRRVTRAGLRFVNPSPELEELIGAIAR